MKSLSGKWGASMPTITLSNVKIEDNVVWANGYFSDFERIRLRSFSGHVSERPVYAAEFFTGEVKVGFAALTRQDFLTLYHAVKPEVRDDLNVLGIGMKSAPSKDQLQGAGTNSFTQV